MALSIAATPMPPRPRHLGIIRRVTVVARGITQIQMIRQAGHKNQAFVAQESQRIGHPISRVAARLGVGFQKRRQTRHGIGGQARIRCELGSHSVRIGCRLRCAEGIKQQQESQQCRPNAPYGMEKDRHFRKSI
jgi:hypothetical protein